MNIKANYRTKYYRPIVSVRFHENKASDKPIIKLNNFIAKKIKVCPQATARVAILRGLEVLAKEAGIDLSEVLLTETDKTAEHGPKDSNPENKSQGKKSVEAG